MKRFYFAPENQQALCGAYRALSFADKPASLKIVPGSHPSMFVEATRTTQTFPAGLGVCSATQFDALNACRAIQFEFAAGVDPQEAVCDTYVKQVQCAAAVECARGVRYLQDVFGACSSPHVQCGRQCRDGVTPRLLTVDVPFEALSVSDFADGDRDFNSEYEYDDAVDCDARKPGADNWLALETYAKPNAAWEKKLTALLQTKNADASVAKVDVFTGVAPHHMVLVQTANPADLCDLNTVLGEAEHSAIAPLKLVSQYGALYRKTEVNQFEARKDGTESSAAPASLALGLSSALVGFFFNNF